MTFKHYVIDFLYFGFKQANACLFGGLLLFFILATNFFWPADAVLARYDLLFLIAIAIQGALLALKLETWNEAKVILVFHVVGTIMELFKTKVGSWAYPEANLIRIGEVPLFTGFMYSAVGSYMARVWRIFDFRFTHYPPIGWTVLLSAAIYVNFFTHHYTLDVRYMLFAATAFMYWRTQVYYRPNQETYRMPLLLGFFLVAFFIWLAENFGTFGKVWLYPSQKNGWHLVSVEKIGSWFLLMIISSVLVTLVHGRRHASNQP